MKNIHLTDEILQAYLLKEIPDDAIASHLSMCTSCKKRFEEYQFLINNIQKIETDTLYFDVTTLVMNNILQYEKTKNKQQNLFFWGILILLLIAISSLSIPYLPAIVALLNPKTALATLLLIGTGLAVWLFLLIDLVQQYKKKEDQIFKNNLQPML